MIAEMEKDEDSCDYYKISLDDVRNSDITKWYKEFQHSTILSVMIQMPPDVMTHLRDPEVIHHEDLCASPEWDDDDDVEDDEEFNVELAADNTEQDDDEAEPVLQQRSEISETVMKEFNEKINDHIKTLGGSVIPKVNWVAPKDANWVGLNRSLKCTSSSDVFLLLKTSNEIYDIVKNGFSNYQVIVPDETPLEYNLVLRKWMDNISSDMEFRCFVCDERLTAICQKDIEVGYNSISNQRDAIIMDIHNFFCDKIHGRYLSNFYVFDIVRLGPGRLLLMDFGVFGLPTDPLLFTYRELRMLMDEINANLHSKPTDAKSKSGLRDVFVFGEPYFRYLTGDLSVRPLQRNGISPSDITTYLREATSV